MYNGKMLSLLLLLFVFILSACGANQAEPEKMTETEIVKEPKTDNTRAINVKLITSEKKLPQNIDEIAFKRQSVPYYEYLVMRAENEKDYEQIWKYYELTPNNYSVNFTEHDAYFIGVRESGSCPVDLGDVKINPEGTALTVHLRESGGTCTADATPRTFVIEVNRDEGENIEEVIIVEGETETAVPVI
ncbi:hypothetical protein [Paenibacillus sp. GCM10027626]|uniref:hypothetical protein n=1 Tax=Paenibacillus sp. GCM10027626 TaxID=3273411 RepID=UPI003643F294